MRKCIALALAMLFAVGISSANAPDKEDVKTEFLQSVSVKMESKEALKIDDAEYTGAVISKTRTAGFGFLGASVALMGIFTFIGNLFRGVNLRKLTFILVGLAVIAVSISVNASAETYLVLATAPVVLPSEELKAIQDISTQIDGFKTTLGSKADKAEFEKVNSTLDDMRKNIDKWNDAKLDEKMQLVNDAITKFGTQIEEMQEDQRRQKDSGGGKTVKDLFDHTEVENFVKTIFGDDFNGKKTSHAASFKLNGLFPVRNKAAEIMGADFYVSGSVPDVFTGRTVDPRLYQRTRKKNLILDHIPIETINTPTLYYMEKREVGPEASTDVGAADFISVAGQKPLRSWRVTTGKVDAKKVAIFSTVADKLLRDIPSLENWIREDLVPEIWEEYNDKLLNSDGTGNDPLGILENAVQYSVTPAFAGSNSDANEIDAIIAAAASMSVSKETPVKILVSSDVFYKIHSLKGGDSHYINNGLVFVNNLGQLFIAGVEVAPVDNDDIDGTEFLLLGADLGFKIKNYGSFSFERGLDGNDFRHDRTSFRAYQEVLSYIPTHRYKSVMHDTFENVYNALATSMPSS